MMTERLGGTTNAILTYLHSLKVTVQLKRAFKEGSSSSQMSNIRMHPFMKGTFLEHLLAGVVYSLG